MSTKVMIGGESGHGKSTSIRTLNPVETMIINVIGKELPFEGWKKKYNKESKNIINVYSSDKIQDVMRAVDQKMMEKKIIVIDDAQYIMSYEFMARAKEKGYEKFIEIGKNMFDIYKLAGELREDIIVVFLSHTEDIQANGYMKTKIKTIGKMLDDKITLEGLFSVVLQAVARKNFNKEIEHVFVTQSDGTSTVKSPIGMFESAEIPNDLQLVVDCIRKYNS